MLTSISLPDGTSLYKSRLGEVHLVFLDVITLKRNYSSDVKSIEAPTSTPVQTRSVIAAAVWIVNILDLTERL